MSVDPVDGRITYNEPGVTHPRGLPGHIQRAILKCAASSKTRKEFMDMVRGVGILDECVTQNGDQTYWSEIQEMSNALRKYLPEGQ